MFFQVITNRPSPIFHPADRQFQSPLASLTKDILHIFILNISDYSSICHLKRTCRRIYLLASEVSKPAWIHLAMLSIFPNLDHDISNVSAIYRCVLKKFPNDNEVQKAAFHYLGCMGRDSSIPIKINPKALGLNVKFNEIVDGYVIHQKVKKKRQALSRDSSSIKDYLTKRDSSLLEDYLTKKEISRYLGPFEPNTHILNYDRKILVQEIRKASKHPTEQQRQSHFSSLLRLITVMDPWMEESGFLDPPEGKHPKIDLEYYLTLIEVCKKCYHKELFTKALNICIAEEVPLDLKMKVYCETMKHCEELKPLAFDIFLLALLNKKTVKIDHFVQLQEALKEIDFEENKWTNEQLTHLSQILAKPIEVSISNLTKDLHYLEVVDNFIKFLSKARKDSSYYQQERKEFLIRFLKAWMNTVKDDLTVFSSINNHPPSAINNYTFEWLVDISNKFDSDKEVIKSLFLEFCSKIPSFTFNESGAVSGWEIPQTRLNTLEEIQHNGHVHSSNVTYFETPQKLLENILRFPVGFGIHGQNLHKILKAFEIVGYLSKSLKDGELKLIKFNALKLFLSLSLYEYTPQQIYQVAISLINALPIKTTDTSIFLEILSLPEPEPAYRCCSHYNTVPPLKPKMIESFILLWKLMAEKEGISKSVGPILSEAAQLTSDVSKSFEIFYKPLALYEKIGTEFDWLLNCNKINDLEFWTSYLDAMQPPNYKKIEEMLTKIAQIDKPLNFKQFLVFLKSLSHHYTGLDHKQQYEVMDKIENILKNPFQYERNYLTKDFDLTGLHFILKINSDFTIDDFIKIFMATRKQTDIQIFSEQLEVLIFVSYLYILDNLEKFNPYQIQFYYNALLPLKDKVLAQRKDRDVRALWYDYHKIPNIHYLDRTIYISSLWFDFQKKVKEWHKNLFSQALKGL